MMDHLIGRQPKALCKKVKVPFFTSNSHFQKIRESQPDTLFTRGFFYSKRKFIYFEGKLSPADFRGRKISKTEIMKKPYQNLPRFVTHLPGEREVL